MSKRTIVMLTILLPLYLMAKSTLEETFKKVIPAAEKTGIEIRNINGSVEVSSWDKDAVEIVAYKKVQADEREDARKYLSELEIDIEDDEDVISVEVDLPGKKEKNDGFFSWIFSSGGVNSSVAFEIKVPLKFDLDIHSTNGSVTVNKCNGRIRLKTVNGKITAKDIAGTISAKSTNGKIKITMSRVNPNEDMALKTSNGSISLYLPKDVAVDIEARTANGRVDCDFDIQREKSGGKSRLEGSINGGGPLLYLKTINGNIKILKNEA